MNPPLQVNNQDMCLWGGNLQGAKAPATEIMTLMAVPEWGHRHGGIMSCQFLNLPHSPPTQLVDRSSHLSSMEDCLLKR